MKVTMSAKIIGVVLGLAAVQAAPQADTQFYGIAGMSPHMHGMQPMGPPLGADPHMAAGPLPAAEAYPIEDAGHPPHPFGPLPRNCKIEDEIIKLNSCQPTVERVCSKETVDTEEIEYEKSCKNVAEIICNNMPLANRFIRRNADALSDNRMFGIHMSQPHTSITKVKSTCHEVSTEHCFNNPIVKQVPVEAENCHTVTKANCREVERRIPKTICEAVETVIKQDNFPNGK